MFGGRLARSNFPNICIRLPHFTCYSSSSAAAAAAVKNSDIPYKTVRLISETGDNKGIVELTEALSSLPDPSTHDLLLMNAKSDPPVCKIVPKGGLIRKPVVRTSSTSVGNSSTSDSTANSAVVTANNNNYNTRSSTSTATATKSSSSSSPSSSSLTSPVLLADITPFLKLASLTINKHAKTTKELELKSTVADHDYNATKLPKARQILLSGYKLKLTVVGRRGKIGASKEQKSATTESIVTRVVSDLVPGYAATWKKEVVGAGKGGGGGPRKIIALFIPSQSAIAQHLMDSADAKKNQNDDDKD